MNKSFVKVVLSLQLIFSFPYLSKGVSVITYDSLIRNKVLHYLQCHWKKKLVCPHYSYVVHYTSQRGQWPSGWDQHEFRMRSVVVPYCSFIRWRIIDGWIKLREYQHDDDKLGEERVEHRRGFLVERWILGQYRWR